MTDPRRIPARLRKPYILKRSALRRNGKPIRRLGRIGLKRAVAMEKVRREYVAKFGMVDDEGRRLGPCQLDGKMVEFELHHKLKRSDHGDEQPGNLIALCSFHHIPFVHRHNAIYEAVRDSEADVTNGYTLKINWDSFREATQKRSI